jgi:hypothetical protein
VNELAMERSNDVIRQLVEMRRPSPVAVSSRGDFRSS